MNSLATRPGPAPAFYLAYLYCVWKALAPGYVLFFFFQCQTCGKMYSLIESPSGGDLDQCVFCRQKKRSLEHLQELLSS